MPGPAPSVNSPFSRCGAPMQNSTTSRPRCTSPLASGRVLPCSRLSASASLSMSRLRSVDELHHHPGAALRVGGGPFHLGARRRRRRRRPVSSAEASGTRACTSPVAGLKTSAKRPEVPFTCLPLMQWVEFLHGVSLIPFRGTVAANGHRRRRFFAPGRLQICTMEPAVLQDAMQKRAMDWDDLRVFLAVARGESLQARARPAARPGDGGAADHRLEEALARGCSTAPPGLCADRGGAQPARAHAERWRASRPAAIEEAGGQAERLTGTVRIGAPDGVLELSADRRVRRAEPRTIRGWRCRSWRCRGCSSCRSARRTWRSPSRGRRRGG